ncbi:exodeoxyribonuclease VII large subunit [Thermoanaerobacterium thermosaccharolyticum]|uniref:exodeoxyribonuclease VII large subunit n=1 Tax=Thermoanaerobacterium TaxID=28895 RepID=UPI0026E00AEF|nr:exodeoxyribonuclease VII large subunit [Thermoanaerobacterium sp. CMT5567-10]WHE08040.1 exodeoxyribonuclease VII large subunit [Thermoanaerobacterium thermosaccharolyticum]WKV08997.1 exodeoxyribonuclease VII large subunit [Thermoanaerobacterium sp. CMT5567-10]
MLLKTLTVKQVNDYLKSIVGSDIILKHVMIKGEISNLHFRGQALYFTLVDEYSSLKCVMFEEYINDLKIDVKNGMSVIATGRISVYEKSGAFELLVSKIDVEGAGALFLSFEKLKQKLRNEGLFDSGKKKPIPKNPNKIGVITSPTGAAIHDIINILRRRKPSIDILVVPILVQGSSASLEIEEAIKKVNRRNDVDLIILGRGGGSFEDFYPFNEERVARAIYNSRIPIISAVGHETDFTIADFVADLRAPTPSAAAELAVTDVNFYNEKIENYKRSLYHYAMSIIIDKRHHLNSLKKSIMSKNPIVKNQQLKIRLNSLNRIMEDSIYSVINNKKFKYISLIDKLNTLSPLNVLKRGYTLTMDKDNIRPITKVENLSANDKIYVLFEDGEAKCTVNEVRIYER